MLIILLKLKWIVLFSLRDFSEKSYISKSNNFANKIEELKYSNFDMTCQTDVDSLTKIVYVIKSVACYCFENDIIIKISSKYWILKKSMSF